MTYTVDSFGTKQTRFGLYDSDSTKSYAAGDTIIRNGIIYTATTNIPAGTPFNLADSESEPQSWFATVTGGTGGGASITFRDERFFVDSDGKDTFFLEYKPNSITGFFRNGMKLISATYSMTDSDAVIYDYTYNGGFVLREGDEIQITYTTE